MSVEDEQRLYEDHVLRHFEEPFHRGHFVKATHRHRLDNPSCGDSVQLELLINPNDFIEEAWFTGSGCIISQAATSMLVQHIEGQSLNFVLSFRATDMLALFRAPLTVRRQHCCLLAWNALMTAIRGGIKSSEH